MSFRSVQKQRIYSGKMSLSAHQARREHILAVSRDFNSQPRLSEFYFVNKFLGIFLGKRIFFSLLSGAIVQSSTPEMRMLFAFVPFGMTKYNQKCKVESNFHIQLEN